MPIKLPYHMVPYCTGIKSHGIGGWEAGGLVGGSVTGWPGRTGVMELDSA